MLPPRLTNEHNAGYLQLVLLHKGPLLCILDLPHHRLACRCNLSGPLLLLNDSLCDAPPPLLVLQRLQDATINLHTDH
jgi:hypothetical protein